MWPAVNLIGDFVAFLISSDKCEPIEWLCERTEHYIFLFFSAHHSVVFYFRYSVYWWKGSVRFWCLKYC